MPAVEAKTVSRSCNVGSNVLRDALDVSFQCFLPSWTHHNRPKDANSHNFRVIPDPTDTNLPMRQLCCETIMRVREHSCFGTQKSLTSHFRRMYLPPLPMPLYILVRRQPQIRLLAIVVTMLLPAVPRLSAEDSLATVGSAAILEAAKSARLNNEANLKSAIGHGSIKVTILDHRSLKSHEVTDASISVWYAPSRFAVRIKNRLRLRWGTNANDGESAGWVDSNVAEELILFDGERLFSVKWLRDGTCTGEVDFAFKRQAVLGAAGFPFEHPIHIWQDALNISRLKADRTRIKPLQGGGFMAVESMNNLETKIYMLGEFGYDLRRVIKLQIDTGVPIREYAMNWGESDGVYYVKNLSHSQAKTEHSLMSDEMEVVSKKTFRIQYDDFQINLRVPKTAFELAASNIPAGTVFHDNRTSGAKKSSLLYVFDGTQLTKIR